MIDPTTIAPLPPMDRQMLVRALRETGHGLAVAAADEIERAHRIVADWREEARFGRAEADCGGRD